MWDLKKTMNGIAGMRKREAKGLPGTMMTDEERAISDKTHAEIKAALAAREWTGPEHLRPRGTPKKDQL